MLRQLDWTLNLRILNFIHVHYSILCFPQKVTNTFQPLFFFKSRLMLIPSIKSLWPCCFLKAFKLTYVHLLSCLFSQLPPLYSPFLSPSSSSHTHRHTHTNTDTGVLVWSPILLVTKTSFCSCFGLHARPVALPAPTFLRATLFCGSSLISLQFSFVGLFFSVSDLPSPFAWPLCAFSSVNVWVTEFF